MIGSAPFRLFVCTAAATLAALFLAGGASADDAGESAPMSVPEAAAPEPEKTLDDKVGDVLANMGDGMENFAAGAVDVLILRTMGCAATAVGFGFFAVTSPMWAPFLGSTPEGFSESWDIFVIAPVEYTFVRPLGQF